jgi:signal transduction histidine kinase
LFRKYPYKGWLLLSILLWVLAGFRYYYKINELKPARMAQKVEENLRSNEEAFNEILSDTALLDRLFTGRLSVEEIDNLTSTPFFIYAYSNDKLTFWNTNKLLSECTLSEPYTELSYTDRGTFLSRCIKMDKDGQQRMLNVLFPIVVTYPFENNYLKSRFAGAPQIPLSTKIVGYPADNSIRVKSLNTNTAFYLIFSVDDIREWTPGIIMMSILMAALLSTIIWLQLITVYFTRKRSFALGFAITVSAVILFRLITYLFGYPFNIDNLPLFSPQLYASSSFLKSLGDLMLNALCFLWIVVFTLRHVPYRVMEKVKLPSIARYLVAIVIAVSIILFSYRFTSVISSIIMDSMISFDVSHFYSINIYTIAGLFTIGIITSTSCLIIYILNVQYAALIKNRWTRLVLLALVGIFTIYITNSNDEDYFSFYLLGWLLLFIALLDWKKAIGNLDIFSPRMIYWSVFVCAFCAGILQYFNNQKEKEVRKLFAENIIQQRDDVTEYTFKNIAQEIQKDDMLINFLRFPDPDRRKAINERFDALYLGGQLNKYQSRVLLFNNEGYGLQNSDTVSYEALLQNIQNAHPVADSTLYYNENAKDGHYYMAYIPIIPDSINPIGYVFIDFTIKESTGETVYPELLQPGTVKSSQNDAGYSYGVFINNRLITQTNDYSFPIYLTTDTIKNQYTFYNWESSSELWYKADESKTVIVIRNHKWWLESITLFSYLFGMQMLISLLIVLYRTYLAYFSRPKSSAKFINLTLRKRIHFSMLGIVLISFLVIGIVTITFITVQYKQSNRKKLQMVMQLVERSTLQYLKDKSADEHLEDFSHESETSRFKYYVQNLAKAQNIDINVYDAFGSLKVTSQENIYDRSLLGRIINPEAYAVLLKRGRTFWIQNEQIGALSYLSCYVPLRSVNGTTLGYINVPFFSSQKELNFQISNILVALINLYAFIFLVSSVLTVFITQWLTRTLNVVINRFSRLNLSKNELIYWPYEDEIGTLVREYNKMVRKVEENAVLMAQSEREDAWREMARQVAHEIKNPLTPMKLNIQYLQQALKNDYPNVRELASKVSISLIEQIDNLSYIASEFSNFAKMPEAKPEVFSMNDMLTRLVELYRGEKNTNVELKQPAETLNVFCDRSQLLRVFTNLLENAVQAIPEEKNGYVTIQLKKEVDDCIVSIQDNGSGISADVVEKIFQPYFTTKSSGTGLGLAMTKKLIEFWKGSIWFETAEGEGTTFYVRLPISNN